MESCVIEITAAAQKHGNLNLARCGREFFPEDAIGGSTRAESAKPLTIVAHGLPKPIKTDIPTDRITGRPRWIFRERAWVKQFVRCNKLSPGNTIAISRIDERTYRIKPNGSCVLNQTVEQQYTRKMYDPISSMKTQLELFHLPSEGKNKRFISEWGTFKDSLKAPIHRWFTYPAGFSYKAVQFALHAHNIKPGDTVYDPFVGTGTTNITAKTMGINSLGVEAHPFVFLIAETKLNFEISLRKIFLYLAKIERLVISKRKHKSQNLSFQLERAFPELVLKCFETTTLYDLLVIRDVIKEMDLATEFCNFFNVALTAVLRQVANVQTGWPYIAPKKPKNIASPKDALESFSNQIHKMTHDIQITKNAMLKQMSSHKIYNADARDTSKYFDNSSADFVITSPPYLNNYDYADRTRLEMYFFGQANNWADISNKVRTKLITSATTQVSRSDAKYALSHDIQKDSPEVYTFLEDSVRNLARLRPFKGGKKSYDLLVAGYFNDIHLVLKDVFRLLRPSSSALFVLGDSAPYGVHIPTDELIGKIAVGVGFSAYSITPLRTRGGKWKDNPQRHAVKLRESIVTLIKG